MANNYFKEFAVGFVLVVLTILLLNPFHFWMPDMMVIIILVATLAVFSLFASFVLRERSGDERDEANRRLAGRIAFLAGTGVMIVGLIVQAFNHIIDPWLVLALVLMILAKIGMQIYRDRSY